MNRDVIYYPREKILEAVKRFETPFFIYGENRIRENCRRFKNAFAKYFPDFRPLFAVKGNANPNILEIIIDEGFEFDASSESEILLAEKFSEGGMHTGNYSTERELAAVLKSKLILNLDDISMLETVEKLGMPQMLSFRINPGIGGDGAMETNIMAGPEAKYGVPFEKAPKAYRRARELGVRRFGIHMMTGSNVVGEDYFKKITGRLFEIIADIRRKTGIEIELVNIGGGFFVPYRPEEKSLDIERTAKGVREAFDKACAQYKLKEPRLMAEPARYITADAGWLVTKITVVKESYKKFIGLDAATNDLPRPWAYGAYHHISICGTGNIAKKKVPETISVVGSLCENNDQFARDIALPSCRPGDIVVIHNAGCHAFSMGHNYNGKPRHAEYLIQSDGALRRIRREETMEDLFGTVEFAGKNLKK